MKNILFVLQHLVVMVCFVVAYSLSFLAFQATGFVSTRYHISSKSNIAAAFIHHPGKKTNKSLSKRIMTSTYMAAKATSRSDDEDKSIDNNNNGSSGDVKPKKQQQRRIKYELGPTDDIDLSNIWIPPKPVIKPQQKTSIVSRDDGNEAEEAQENPNGSDYDKSTKTTRTGDDTEPSSKQKTTYDVGYGINKPKVKGQPKKTRRKIIAKDIRDEKSSKFIKAGALWDVERNTSTRQQQQQIQQRDPSSSGSGGDDSSGYDTENIPKMLYPNIDLSIPSSIYDPSQNIDIVWDVMRYEAQKECNREPLLVSYLHSTILNHNSLESALAFHLANKLSSPSMISTQIQSLVLDAFCSHDLAYDTECTTDTIDLGRKLRADIMAVRDRDPACTCLPDVFLYFKGFHALQTYRVSNYLWHSNRKVLSYYLQSQMSTNFQIDIHPNATLGSGIMLDHGTGIVIGETAIIGNNCSILHHVTLGGSGKKGVDRHPKVGNSCLLGAGCSILGNINIGDGSQIGAGTLVISDIPSHSVAVGVPAKIIGSFIDVTSQPSVDMNQMTGSIEFDKNLITFESEGI